MLDVQNHAANIDSWELDDLSDWISQMERRRQDLLKAGASESTADDCIVSNLLVTLTSISKDCPHYDEWKFDANTWNSEHENNVSLTWLVLKSRMQKNITKLSRKEQRVDKSKERKKPQKTTTPAGMALTAAPEDFGAVVKALTAVVSKMSEIPVRTRFQKKQKDDASKTRSPIKKKPQQSSVTSSSNRPKQPASGSKELRRDAAGDVIECDLCLKVGLTDPEQINHICKYYPQLRENIEKLSVPTMQGASAPGSSSNCYVAPAGSTQGHARAAFERTPASAGAEFASNVFGQGAKSGMGFSAMRGNKTPESPPRSIPTSPIAPPGSESVSGNVHPTLFSSNVWKYTRILFMVIGVLATGYTAYTTASGVISTVSHISTTMSSLLAVPAVFCRKTDKPKLDSGQIKVALNAMKTDGIEVSPQNAHFLDSGCSFSIISNSSIISDLHAIEPVTIEGLTGTRIIAQGGTLRMSVPDFNSVEHVITIKDVLYDPLSSVNLISVKQMNNNGYGFILMPDEGASMIVTPKSSWPSGDPQYLPIVQQNNVFLLTTIDSEFPSDELKAYNATRFEHSTLEEILHRRFNHAPTERLTKLNGRVLGLPRYVWHTRCTHVKCALCAEANAIQQAFEDASDTKYTRDNDLWSWDMLDMGEQYCMIDGNRYATIFVSNYLRYVMLFLHADNSAPTVLNMMKHARAKAGYWPRFMRSDGAATYHSAEVSALFLEHGIEHQCSNPYEQNQNAAAETVVNMIGRGVRVLLLQSNLPPEFWGLCAHYIVTVYNCLPHSSIDFEIPYTRLTGHKPNVSWFRLFGCASVVFQGK